MAIYKSSGQVVTNSLDTNRRFRFKDDVRNHERLGVDDRTYKVGDRTTIRTIDPDGYTDYFQVILGLSRNLIF